MTVTKALGFNKLGNPGDDAGRPSAALAGEACLQPTSLDVSSNVSGNGLGEVGGQALGAALVGRAGLQLTSLAGNDAGNAVLLSSASGNAEVGLSAEALVSGAISSGSILPESFRGLALLATLHSRGNQLAALPESFSELAVAVGCCGAISCTECAAGRYSNASASNASAVACVVCAAGSVTNTLTGCGAISCTACAAGRYSNASASNASAAACAVCAAGSVTNTLAASNATNHTACVAGQYSNTSTAACVVCLAGSATDTLAVAGAISCSVGAVDQYSNASAAGCAVCPVGSATNTLAVAGATKRTACAVSQYSNDSCVRSVCHWLRHQYADRLWRHQLHCARSGTVQQRINGGVRGSVHVRQARPRIRWQLLVRGGSVQQRIGSRVRGVSGGLGHSCCAADQYSNASAAGCVVCLAGSATDSLAAAGAISCTACAAQSRGRTTIRATHAPRGGASRHAYPRGAPRRAGGTVWVRWAP
jgi:hypothetical protein